MFKIIVVYFPFFYSIFSVFAKIFFLHLAKRCLPSSDLKDDDILGDLGMGLLCVSVCLYFATKPRHS